MDSPEAHLRPLTIVSPTRSTSPPATTPGVAARHAIVRAMQSEDAAPASHSDRDWAPAVRAQPHAEDSASPRRVDRHSALSPDDDTHVRLPSGGKSKGAYQTLAAPPRLSTVEVRPVQLQHERHVTFAGDPPRSRNSSRPPSPSAADGKSSLYPPPPCFTSPLLLCTALMGAVFLLCGILVGIAVSAQPPRSAHVATYNQVVRAWNSGGRASFAKASFAITMHSPEPEPHLDPLPSATGTDGATRRRLFEEDSTGAGFASSVDSSSSVVQSDSAEGSSSAESTSSTAPAWGSSSMDSDSSSAADQSSSAAAESSSTVELSSSASESSSAIDGSSSGMSSSAGDDAESSSILSSSGPGSSSAASSSADASSSEFSSSADFSSSASFLPSPPVNSPNDPWLARNSTALSKMSSGDALNDLGSDVERYAPLHFALFAHSLQPVHPEEELVSTEPTSSFAELPSLLLRNRTHARAWLDREDFSLNETTVLIDGHVNEDSGVVSRSSLQISLPFLHKEIAISTPVLCKEKLHGLWDDEHSTCLSFKQLVSLCVRVAHLSGEEITELQRKANVTLVGSPAASSAYVFDTSDLADFSDDPDNSNAGAAGAPAAPALSDSSSTSPRWSDATRLGAEDAPAVPGCVRHATAGWQVGVYARIPVETWRMYSEATGQMKHGKHAVVVPLHSIGREDGVPFSFASALASLPEDSPLRRSAVSESSFDDLLLVRLSLSALNVSIRSRGDPYLMAQSLTRSSLWFGLPSSELILFTLFLVLVGLLLEVAPVYAFSRWWTVRKMARSEAAAEGEVEDDAGGADEEIDLSDDDEEKGTAVGAKPGSTELTQLHSGAASSPSAGLPSSLRVVSPLRTGSRGVPLQPLFTPDARKTASSSSSSVAVVDPDAASLTAALSIASPSDRASIVSLAAPSAADAEFADIERELSLALEQPSP